MKTLFIISFLFFSSTAAFGQEEIYTLYRDSAASEKIYGEDIDSKWHRVHLATFDAKGMDSDYNRSHCNRVRNFYDNEWMRYYDEKPDDWSNFWCEKGRYRPE